MDSIILTESTEAMGKAQVSIFKDKGEMSMG